MESKICALCRTASTEYFLGPLYCFENFFFHANCIAFSTGLHQISDQKAKNLYGFPFDKIKEVIQYSNFRKCALCRQKGATINCSYQNCPLYFHLNCGLKSKLTLHLYFDDYASFCPRHNPICIFDGDRIVGLITKSAVKPNCCGKKIYHFNCIEKYVINSGNTSKCPNCNNKEQFYKHMKSNDILPQNKSPEWAENEITGYYLACSALKCLYKKGKRRFSFKEGSELWDLIKCRHCGSEAIHIKCGNVTGREWSCYVCTPNTDISIYKGSAKLGKPSKVTKIVGSKSKRFNKLKTIQLPRIN